MSRWAWHPRHGVRKGPIMRVSDVLTPGQLEKQVHDQNGREYDWLQHHPKNELTFTPTRVCMICGAEDRQEDMRWTGKRWLCPKDYDEFMTQTALGMLQ